MIFIYNFFYLLLLTLIENKIKLNKKIYLILCIFPMIMMIIYMKNVPDYEYYFNSYVNINNSEHLIHINLEKIYLFSTKIFYNLGFSYHFFRSILLIIILIIFSKMIYSKDIICFKFLLFYCCTFVFSILVQYRSGLALALYLMLGIKLLLNKKRLFYIIYIFILAQIHSSIILFLPLVFLEKIKNNEIKIFILVCTLLIPVFYREVIEILELLSQYIPNLSKINNYLSNPAWIFINGSYGNRDYFTIIIYLIFLIVFKKITQEENIYMWIFYLSIFYRSFFIKVPEVGFRAYLLCQFSLVILVSKLSSKNLFIKILCSLVMFMYFYLLISKYGDGALLKNY